MELLGVLFIFSVFGWLLTLRKARALSHSLRLLGGQRRGGRRLLRCRQRSAPRHAEARNRASRSRRKARRSDHSERRGGG